MRSEGVHVSPETDKHYIYSKIVDRLRHMAHETLMAEWADWTEPCILMVRVSRGVEAPFLIEVLTGEDDNGGEEETSAEDEGRGSQEEVGGQVQEEEEGRKAHAVHARRHVLRKKPVRGKKEVRQARRKEAVLT